MPTKPSPIGFEEIIGSIAEGASKAIQELRKEEVDIELGEFEVSLRLRVEVEPKSLVKKPPPKKGARKRKTRPSRHRPLRFSKVDTAPRFEEMAKQRLAKGEVETPAIPWNEANLEIRVLLIPKEPEED